MYVSGFAACPDHTSMTLSHPGLLSLPPPSVRYAHPRIAEAVAGYLAAADAEAPGLVEGLYLTGSAALGDFCPRTSDVDVVAVTARRLDAAARGALRRVHGRLARTHSRGHVDALYVTWAELAGDPAHRRGPHTHAGRFHAEDAPGDPVTWHTVARHGVACRGPVPTVLDVWADAAALAAWSLDNLDRYWGRLLERATRPFDRWSAAALTPYGAVWIVLGVTRIHYTLATGALCSKADAGRYALATFPEARWQRVVTETLRLRAADRSGPGVAGALTGALDDLRDLAAAALDHPRARGAPTDHSPRYRTPLARRRDVLAFGAMVAADARARDGARVWEADRDLPSARA